MTVEEALPAEVDDPESAHICFVGPSFRFFSGISVYNWSVTQAAVRAPGVHKVSAVLLRRLLPQRLYPGATRVGAKLTDLTYEAVDHFDGIDWYWGASLVRSLRFLARERPTVLVVQWWTAAVGHSLLALAWWARRHDVTVLVEIHELQDVGEASSPLVRAYGRSVLKRLVRLSSGVVLHHEHDRHLLRERGLLLDDTRTVTAPHGPYDHHKAFVPRIPEELSGTDALDEAEPTVHLLYFGVIREYKGVEDLVEAFGDLPVDVASRLRLTLVGETWEGWTTPVEMARSCRYADRIHVVNRYVTDEEAAYLFGRADIVVLPYRRSSSSGPLHIAMAHGIRVITYDHGSLRASAQDYTGVEWVPAGDVAALASALARATLDGSSSRVAPVGDWDVTMRAYADLTSHARAAVP